MAELRAIVERGLERITSEEEKLERRTHNLELWRSGVETWREEVNVERRALAQIARDRGPQVDVRLAIAVILALVAVATWLGIKGGV